MELTRHICFLCFIYFVVSCSVTRELAQTMTSLTGITVDETSLCLVNQPVNMFDGVSLYTSHRSMPHERSSWATYSDLPLKICTLWQCCTGSAFTIQFIVMLPGLKEKGETVRFSFYFSSVVGFYIKHTILKCSSYQALAHRLGLGNETSVLS